MAPLVADQLTAELNAPVPCTVAAQEEVWVVTMDAGVQITATLVMVGGTFTVTVADPDLVVSCVDVAVMDAVPEFDGVKTPELLTEPTVAGVTDHVTEELKVPVPFTVAEQVDDCVVRMEVDEQVTETDVIAEAGGVLPPPPFPQPVKSAMTPAAHGKKASVHPK